MAENDDVVRVIVEASRLPKDWPTHSHPPEFWEQLGRTIATFGLLEKTLAKTVFVHTGTRRYDLESIEKGYATWIAKMERIFSENMASLADAFAKAVREHPENTIENIEELQVNIKTVAEVRNMLCHGSWQSPDGDGFSMPFFQNRRGEVFSSSIDVAYLRQVQQHARELTCAVINSVTHMGFAFPGSDGPGRKIWPDR